MRLRLAISILLLLSGTAALAAPKQHVILLGKTIPVQLFVGPTEESKIQITIRPLFVDGNLKEFTTGEPHDVTDRLFVIRKAFRVNDWLPEDEGKPHRWKWQRGGWLLVDRTTGRVSQLSLPEFDPFYSGAAWYRDYVAYCGISDSGEKLYAVVAQLGQKRPLLRRELGPTKGSPVPESECATPVWQRQPPRVTFAPAGGQQFTFEVHNRWADMISGDSNQQQEQK